MRGQRREAPGQVLGIGHGQIAKGRREAVAAMFQGNAAQEAQGVLQTAGQGWVTFTAQDDLGMLEAGKGEGEMVEPVFQHLAANDDAQAVHVGEVGQAHSAWLLDLREHDISVGAMQGFPLRDPPFQRAPERWPDAIGMTPFHLVEQGNWAQAGGRHQQRQDFLLPQTFERVGPGSPGPTLLLHAWRPGIEVNATRGRDRQARFGGGGYLGVVSA